MMPVYLRAAETADRIVGLRAALLDRDGTIVHDRQYLNDPAGLEFLPMAAAGLRRLYGSGYRLVVVSNQSGVGRRLISIPQLEAMNVRLAQMSEEIGAPLAGIFCCPHLPEAHCACRKPQPGLINLAASMLGFDPRQSVVIGDRTSDIELGLRVGARTAFIGHSEDVVEFRPSIVAANLEEAAGLLG